MSSTRYLLVSALKAEGADNGLQLHCVKSLREQVWRPASLEEHYEGENSWGRHLG
jgi:hypothetical protein